MGSMMTAATDPVLLQCFFEAGQAIDAACGSFEAERTSSSDGASARTTRNSNGSKRPGENRVFADRHGADRISMEGVMEGDERLPSALPEVPPVLVSQLQRNFDGRSSRLSEQKTRVNPSGNNARPTVRPVPRRGDECNRQR